jgi:hypothetical protein
MKPHALAFTAVVLAAATSQAAADGVKIGVHIGVPVPPPVVVAPPAVVVAPPPPPVVVAAPPQLVVVPGTPVFYAPSASINVFAYGGQYYSFHEGAWFVAPGPGRRWVAIAPARVPRPVLAVPVGYYKIPPGHAKKLGHGEGPGHGCPPGLAKKGRC